MNLAVNPPVLPMLAKRVSELPPGEGWIFEPKWDGFRTLIFRDGDEIFIQSRDEKPLNRYFPELIDPLKAQLPKLHYQRNSVYLRFCHVDYDKGTALAELGRLLEIPVGSIFAAGDHYNDLPMLDGRAAKHVACPANAIAAVKQTVRAAGGHVSAAEDGYGLVDALKRHFD